MDFWKAMSTMKSLCPLNLIEASIVFYYLMVDRYWDIVTDTFIEYENWIVCTF